LGDFEQHRPRTTTPQLGEGAPHQLRHPFDQVDFGAPFRDRLITARRGKIGVDAAPLPCHPGGQEQNGDGFRVGLGHAAKAVFGPWAILHHEDANPVAIGDAGIAVDHVDPGTFLPEDDRPNPGNGRGL
jgi:hypothetical protein